MSEAVLTGLLAFNLVAVVVNVLFAERNVQNARGNYRRLCQVIDREHEIFEWRIVQAAERQSPVSEKGSGHE